jgi:hypothetical protein
VESADDLPPNRWGARSEVVVDRGGDTIAAWTELYAEQRGIPDRFMAAVARRGRPFGRPQVIAAGPRADAALPRMAVLADGRVMLVWRAAREPVGGELRVAFLGAGERFARSRGLGRDGVAPAVVATSDGGAVIASTTPFGRPLAPRVLRAARLPARGHRLGRSFRLSSSAVTGARLAAGPGNVAIASWAIRRPPVNRFATHVRLLAARLTPRRGPLRVIAPESPKATAAAVALGPGGAALAAFPDTTSTPGCGCPEIGQWAASGTAAGGFAAAVPLTPTAPAEVSALARPTILPTGEALVVWSETRLGGFDVLVARKPAGSAAFDPVETLGSGHHGTDALRPVALAQAAGRVLVAWPAPGPSGGLVVAERP